MNLVDSLASLITEGVANSTIKDAITNKHVCNLRYMNDNKLPGPSLKVNKKGVPLPDWRLFRVDRMDSFAPISSEGDEIFKTFEEPPMYNKVGDKSMSRMDYNSKF